MNKSNARFNRLSRRHEAFGKPKDMYGKINIMLSRINNNEFVKVLRDKIDDQMIKIVEGMCRK